MTCGRSSTAWHPIPCCAAIGDIARETITLFGAERCLFGSNFPIEKLWSSYDGLIQAYRAALADYPAQTQKKIFSTTAKRVYRI
jgi:predicted TIM-barrel fold metal-dependent hydrolase